MNSIKRPCQAKKADGAGCQAAALPDSEFCFFHDPGQAEKRHDARSFGGSQNRMKTLSADHPDMKVESCQDIVKLMTETINQVRKGDLDPRVANAVGYLANVLIKALDVGDLEKRMEDLESAILNRKGNHSDVDISSWGKEYGH